MVCFCPPFTANLAGNQSCIGGFLYIHTLVLCLCWSATSSPYCTSVTVAYCRLESSFPSGFQNDDYHSKWLFPHISALSLLLTSVERVVLMSLSFGVSCSCLISPLCWGFPWMPAGLLCMRKKKLVVWDLLLLLLKPTEVKGVTEDCVFARTVIYVKEPVL